MAQVPQLLVYVSTAPCIFLHWKRITSGYQTQFTLKFKCLRTFRYLLSSFHIEIEPVGLESESISRGKMASLGGQRIEERKSEFMSCKPITHLKAMRETFSVELRKQNRRDRAQKRRMLMNTAYAVGEEGEGKPLLFDAVPIDLVQICPVIVNEQADEESKASALKTVIETAQSQDIVLMALTVLRKSLCNTSAPPVNILLKLDFMPLLLCYLEPETCSIATLAETAWIVCNILSGPRSGVDRAISLGVIGKLIAVIRGDMLGVAENAIWALGNIAVDGVANCNMLLAAGIEKVLFQLVMESPELHCALSRVTAWLCNLLLMHTEPAEETIRIIYQILVTLYDMDDLDTKQEVLVAAGAVHNWTYPMSRIVSATGMLNILLADPCDRDDCLVKPSVKALSHLTEADEETTQMALDAGLLDTLSPWLSHPEADIRRNVFLTLSNVTAGTPCQITQFCRHPICAEAVKFLDDPVCAVRMEVSYLYCNLVKQATVTERFALIDYTFFLCLKRLFEDKGFTALNAIKIADRMLAAGEIRAMDKNSTTNTAADLLDSSGCLQAIMALAQQNVPNISSEAEHLVNTYFDGAEEREAEFS